MTTASDTIIGAFFLACAAIIAFWCWVYRHEHAAVLREFRTFLHDCFCDDTDTPDRTTGDRAAASAVADDRLRAARPRLDAAARTGADLPALRDVSGHVARVDRPLGASTRVSSMAARPKGFKRIY